MILRRLSRSALCFLLCFALVEVPFALKAQAAMIPTAQVVTDLEDQQNREKVAAFLQREDIRSQILSYGVSPSEADQRVASLSRAEVQNLAGKIDQAPAGGDIGGILVIVLLVVLIIFLVKRI